MPETRRRRCRRCWWAQELSSNYHRRQVRPGRGWCYFPIFRDDNYAKSGLVHNIYKAGDCKLMPFGLHCFNRCFFSLSLSRYVIYQSIQTWNAWRVFCSRFSVSLWFYAFRKEPRIRETNDYDCEKREGTCVELCVSFWLFWGYILISDQNVYKKSRILRKKFEMLSSTMKQSIASTRKRSTMPVHLEALTTLLHSVCC